MAEHHQQYMRNSSLRIFPDGSAAEMDPAAAAAAVMLTEKARNALGLPPSSAYYGAANPQNRGGRNPSESSPFQPFVNPAAAAAAMSQLYGRVPPPSPHGHPHHPGGMIPPPHFWSQFYGLNHQLGILAGLQQQQQQQNPADSPPPSSPFQSQQRFSPYPLSKPRSTPSPRVIPSPK